MNTLMQELSRYGQVKKDGIEGSIYVKLSNFYHNRTPTHQEIGWFHQALVSSFDNGIELLFAFSYTNDEMLLIEVCEMKKKLTVEILYSDYDKYITAVYNINNSVDRDGLVSLFVCNIPFYLKVYLVIECKDHEMVEIRKIIELNKLIVIQEKGYEELMQEASERKYNFYSFVTTMNFELFEMIYRNCFMFSSKDALIQKGYNVDSDIKRNKLFVSYAWKDSAIVDEFVQRSSENGLSLFYDKQSIDFGQKILERIMEGLKECDLAIFFISKNFKESCMAKHELTSIWSRVISGKKKWVIVKMDQTDPNEIYTSLGDYKYFDLSTSGLDELIKIIDNKVNGKGE